MQLLMLDYKTNLGYLNHNNKSQKRDNPYENQCFNQLKFTKNLYCKSLYINCISAQKTLLKKNYIFSH